jgi:hypothetical protein
MPTRSGSRCERRSVPRRREFTAEVAKMSRSERVGFAKCVVTPIVDHLLYVLALHANNAVVVYSDKLASQIPVSHAANAFNIFQASLHSFEIVRLCALWDRPSFDRESIPTVVELIDHREVIALLADDMRRHWTEQPFGSFRASTSDPELEALHRQSELAFGNQQANVVVQALTTAIGDARKIMASPKLRSVRHLRDHRLAHSLLEDPATAHGVERMHYGDESDLLRDTIPIIERLRLGVSGVHMEMSESQEIDRHNAEALWHGCRFEVLD